MPSQPPSPTLLRRTIRGGSLCLLACLATAAHGQQPSSDAEPIYWGRHGLAIPYRWASEVDPHAASQVVLYVVEGSGSDWKQVATAAPNVSSFLYQAPGDGAYQFAVRTYDRYGSFLPPGPPRAEMRVVVDTQPPVITRLDGQVRGGFARVEVGAVDQTAIAPGTLTLHFQTDPYSGWSPASLTPTGSSATTGVRATAEFRVPTGTQTLKLRLNVSDRAGNPAERTAEIADRATAPPAPLLTGPSMIPSQSLTATKNPFDALGPSPPPRWNAPPVDRTPEPIETRRPVNGWTSVGRSAAIENPASTESQPWPIDSGRTQALTASARTTIGPNGGASPFSNASLLSRSPRSTRDDFFDEPNERVDRTVSSRRFEFDYDLEDVGRWGVATVELWGSDDGGATWRRFAIDNDRQSPIHVEAPGEGVYGFRLLVEAVGGLPPERPRPGDRPEVTVCVDLQRPAAVLTRVEQGQGYLGDQLTIDWRVNEQRPAKRPIDLYYSNRPDGPWAPIATGLEDTGRYAWRLQRHVPEQLFVRLEARDDAGNVGVAVTPEAVALRLPKPTGSLRGVRTQAATR